MSGETLSKKYTTHRFKVGSFHCVAIDDGGLVYGPPLFPEPATCLFTDAPEEEIAAALAQHGLNRETWKEQKLPYTCVLISTGSHRVLVDTGAGSFTPETGQLMGALDSLGVSPKDIDAVCITHGHCDHINGCKNEDGTPAFPNAQYVMTAKEHAFWTGPDTKEMLGEEMANLLVPIARAQLEAIDGKLKLISEPTEAVPGVTAHPAYGHTPGHLVVEVKAGEGKNESMYVLGDSIIHPIHCQCPQFSSIFDVIREDGVQTRRGLLKKLSEEGCLVQLYHFPFPGIGRIEDKGNGSYKYRAVDDLPDPQ